jgi:hypothetical protein
MPLAAVCRGSINGQDNQGSRVSDNPSVNLSSLNIVKGEFLATIQNATNQLEQFISGRERADLLQSCLEQLHQIHGVTRIVQLYGADVLSTEMINALQTVPVGADDSYDALLGALSTSSFVIARYFEYAQQYERTLPALLLPFANELREAHGEKALPDGMFFKMNAAGMRPERAGGGEYSTDSARRFRHMYQVGLLGILQGQNADYSLGLIQRALERMDTICTGYAFSNVLWSASCAIAAMREKGLVFTRARKMLFSALDRYMKQLLKQGEEFLDKEAASELLREFVYVVAVSGSESDSSRSIKHIFAVMPLGYSEDELEIELDNLRGPGMSTVHSVAEVIREELRISKNSLEVASEGACDVVSMYPDMIASLTRVADTLTIVGLATPGHALREQVAKMQSWLDAAHVADNTEMVDVADTLLYIESMMTALESMNLSQAKLKETNALHKDEIIAKSQLAEAEKVVLDEAQEGFALIKRSLASYMESGYDVMHIANLSKTMNSVRGGLTLLNMPRASKVVASCIAFVDERLMQGGTEGAMQQLLETFADAVMSLEYYIEAYIAVHQQDPMILEVAEESVKALGYPVN